MAKFWEIWEQLMEQDDDGDKLLQELGLVTQHSGLFVKVSNFH